MGWPPRIEQEYVDRIASLDAPEDAKQVARRLLETFSGQSDGDDGKWRDSLGPCLRAIISKAAQRQPLCLLLEDIQWLDEASAAVLTEALGQKDGWPVLILLASREPIDQEFPSALEPTLLPLTALPAGIMRQLILSWAAPDLLPESTVEAICRRAEGHPYFARELVHSLRQTDASPELPHTLQELFMAQLDWLPLHLRRLVQAASVLGEPMTTGLLEAALGTETPLTGGLLAEAVRNGLLCTGHVPDRFILGRRLLFEAAYTTIPPTRKRDLHARIATRIIEQREALGELALHSTAHHAYLGFGDERAIELLLASARRYREEYSNRQAIQDASRAIELMNALPDPQAAANQRLEALWLLAQSYQVLGDTDQAGAVLAEAEMLSDSCTDRPMVAQIALASATLSFMERDIPEAERRFARARKTWEELGDATRVAHALLGMGMCAWPRADGGRALELYCGASSAPEVAMWVRAAALNNAGMVLLASGRYLAAEPFLAEGLATNESEGDRRGVAYSQTSLGELHYRLARSDEAAGWLYLAWEGARQIEDPQCMATAGLLRARVCILCGDIEAARQALAEAQTASGLDPDLDALMALVETELRCARDVTLPMVELPTNLEWPGTLVCRNLVAETTCLAAEALLRSGHSDQAAATLGQLAATADQVPDQHLRRFAIWLLSLANAEPEGWSGFLPDPDGEWTVYDERAKRLLHALRPGDARP